MAHPGVVCDVAIRQSTQVTERVIANLFYRGLILKRPVQIGETLHTSIEIVALHDNRPNAGRQPTEVVALRITTVDQGNRPVLDFYRCAMLLMRNEAARPGHADDLTAISSELDLAVVAGALSHFDLNRYRAIVPGILAPRSPLEFSAHARLRVRRPPLLREHTEAVLAEVLGLSPAEIGRLVDRQVVAGVNREMAV